MSSSDGPGLRASMQPARQVYGGRAASSIALAQNSLIVQGFVIEVMLMTSRSGPETNG